jgi:uncharacterized lipoprotein YehR (DUF1307 family)
MKNKINLLKIFSVLVVFVVLIIFLINQYNNRKYVVENFNAIEANITFVFNTGRMAKARTILDIEYMYNNQKVKSKITRQWNGNDYYKKGEKITIYINPDDENDIR